MFVTVLLVKATIGNGPDDCQQESKQIVVDLHDERYPAEKEVSSGHAQPGQMSASC